MLVSIALSESLISETATQQYKKCWSVVLEDNTLWQIGTVNTISGPTLNLNQQKVVYGLSNGAIFNGLKRPGFKVTLFFDAKYRRNGTRYRHGFNGILIGTYMVHTPYSTVSFRMTLSDFEWLRKICDDTKHRAASLRQQRLLSLYSRRYRPSPRRQRLTPDASRLLTKTVRPQAIMSEIGGAEIASIGKCKYGK